MKQLIKLIGYSILYLPFTLILASTLAYATRTIQNDCVIKYVRSGLTEGVIYRYPSGQHIEGYNEAIIKDKVGYAKGCIMHSGNLYADISNTAYCGTVVVLEKLF